MLRLPAIRLLFPLFLGVLLGVAVVPGCTYLKEVVGLGLQRPKVSLADLAVTKWSLSTLGLLVTLRVDNPNGFEIEVAKLTYQLRAAGHHLAAGESLQHVTIPAEAHAMVKLPLAVDTASALKVLRDLLAKSEDALVEVQAKAYFDTVLGPMAVPFEDKHQLRKLAGF